MSAAAAKMPFWSKKRDSTGDAASASESNNGVNNGGSDNKEEKVNYKARLEHKQYLVSEAEEATCRKCGDLS